MPKPPFVSWIFACLACAAPAQQEALVPAAGNPYRLQPFHADFPVELEYPPYATVEYERTRRQILAKLAENLAGNVRRESWMLATEFFWRAPEDAVEPLIEAMDRAMGNPALADVVKNCVEAMGRMAVPEFDPALQRARQHANPAVQQAAFLAMTACGTPATLRELGKHFMLMNGRARTAWLRAVRLRLGADGVEVLREIMVGPYSVVARDEVLKEALQLPPSAAAKVLRGRWDEAIGEFKAIIAGVLHAAGDAAGTAWLQDALGSEDLLKLTQAIRHCGFGELGSLREPLLRTSTHLRPEVRLEVAKALLRLDGDDVADIYEVLSGPDEPFEVRAIALRELTRRGRGKVVDVMLEELPTATGTRLSILLNELTASGDARAVPIMVDRFVKAGEGQGRAFLQSLSQNTSPAATAALLEIFQGPERLVSRSQTSGVLTTRNYVPTLLLNQRGREALVLQAFAALPAERWADRALLLPTLTGIAADRDDEPLREQCLAPVRKILFDRSELPQLRVLALNLLSRRWFTIDDVLRLKDCRRDEAPNLRRLFTDFLLDSY
ncbi:MAG: hypothetical protein K8J09_03445 [Planctomycetes bacterium]|nr:hypothetical protein [Planctomycetota bacterium]MCC7399589.1 hypothetical protein [Planctomycetota bacterium]